MTRRRVAGTPPRVRHTGRSDRDSGDAQQLHCGVVARHRAPVLPAEASIHRRSGEAASHEGDLRSTVDLGAHDDTLSAWARRERSPDGWLVCRGRSVGDAVACRGGIPDGATWRVAGEKIALDREACSSLNLYFQLSICCPLGARVRSANHRWTEKNEAEQGELCSRRPRPATVLHRITYGDKISQLEPDTSRRLHAAMTLEETPRVME